MGRHKTQALSQEMMQRITLAAELYYVYNLTQNDIAEQLGVSRVWVGKLLQKAEELGVVRIEVNTASAGITELEQALRNKFGIKCAKVVRCAGSEPCIQAGARAAASYLAGILRHSDCVSTFWGATLAAVVSEFVPLHFPGVTVVPFAGGLGFDKAVTPNQIAYTLAEKLSAKISPLHAPGIVAGRKERDLLLSDPTIREVVNLSENADILVLGMGPLWHPTLVSTHAVSDQDFEELRALGCAGDICLTFLDRQGRLIDHPIQERILGGSLEKARPRAREVIAVACGDTKAGILRATMLGKWVDTVITDENTARAVMAI
jgi:DNA-binding transcriptional regulator LsrR (DeoR family)